MKSQNLGIPLFIRCRSRKRPSTILMRSPTSPTRSAFTVFSTPTLHSRPCRYTVSRLDAVSYNVLLTFEQYTLHPMLPSSASTSTMSEQARAPSSRLNIELPPAFLKLLFILLLRGATVRIIPHIHRLRQSGVCIQLFFYPSFILSQLPLLVDSCPDLPSDLDFRFISISYGQALSLETPDTSTLL
jgi:hypothetical protein